MLALPNAPDITCEKGFPKLLSVYAQHIFPVLKAANLTV